MKLKFFRSKTCLTAFNKSGHAFVQYLIGSEVLPVKYVRNAIKILCFGNKNIAFTFVNGKYFLLEFLNLFDF